MVKAHRAALDSFMLRVQQLAAMWVRLAATGTTPPEQLDSFEDVLNRAHAAIGVRSFKLA
jgi:hypothetical protein